MLFIEYWSGRFGNNILQLVRAIHYAKVRGHWEVSFPAHPLLTVRSIRLTGGDKSDLGNTARLIKTFTNMAELKVADATPATYRAYALKYIRSILRVSAPPAGGGSDLVVHFRGGDLFGAKPHPSYVQPPLWFYKKAVGDYDGSAAFVYEDLKNPCVGALLGDAASVSAASLFTEDLAMLLNSKHLVAGFTTLAFAVYLLNPALTSLTIPDYFAASLPAGEWGEGFTLKSVAVPGYIQVGEWANTPAQRELMLSYEPAGPTSA